jgi:hypothetical protein
MTTALAPGPLRTALPGHVLRGLPETARSRLARVPVLTYPEQSGLDPGSGSFDGLLLRQGEFFPEHAPRDMVGHHEREGNGLTHWKPEGGSARRPEDLLEPVPAPRSHVPHLRADVGFVEFEQRGERRALLLVHVEQDGDELPETLSRLSGLGDFELVCIPERLQQLRLDRSKEVLARGEVVVDRPGGGVRPLGDHVHRQAVCAHLPEHLNRCLDKTPPA